MFEIPPHVAPLLFGLALIVSTVLSLGFAKAGDDKPDDKPGDKPDDKPDDSASIADMVKAFLSERGGSTDPQTSSAVGALLTRLAGVERDRDAKAARLKTIEGKVPGESDVVLTGDDAAGFAALKEAYAAHRAAFGGPEAFTMDAMAAALKAGAEAVTAAATAKHKSTIEAACKVAGVGNVDLLRSLAGFGDLDVVVEGEGDDAKAFARVTKGDATEKVALADHLRAVYPAAAPALFVDAPKDDGTGGAPSLPKGGAPGGGGGTGPTTRPKARPRIAI